MIPNARYNLDIKKNPQDCRLRCFTCASSGFGLSLWSWVLTLPNNRNRVRWIGQGGVRIFGVNWMRRKIPHFARCSGGENRRDVMWAKKYLDTRTRPKEILVCTVQATRIVWKIILTSGSQVNMSTFFSPLQLTRRNTKPTSYLLRISRRKHVTQTSSHVYSNICSRWLGMCIMYPPALSTAYLFFYRKHAKVSREGAPQASNISNDEIEAAKKEWADLVLTDDE